MSDDPADSYCGGIYDSHDGEPVLEMPFIACESAGGSFDDMAFTRGWECGAIDQYLKHCKHAGEQPEPRYVPADIVDQIDLIAMRHEMSMTKTTHEDPFWILIAFY